VKQSHVCGGVKGELINSFARRDCFIRNTLKEQNHVSSWIHEDIIVATIMER